MKPLAPEEMSSAREGNTLSTASTTQPSSPRLDMSFPKRVRLRKRGQFMKTQREGVRLKGASFFAYARFTRAPQVRLGLTASKKVGKAHERNRYKRLAREAFRRSELRQMSGVDLVVIIRQERPPLALQPLIEELNTLAEQLKTRASKQTSKQTSRRTPRNTPKREPHSKGQGSKRRPSGSPHV